MTAPVIAPILAPTTVTYGQPWTVDVPVTDPDATAVNLTATATNQTTGEASSAGFSVDVADPIGVAVVSDDPRVVVTPDATLPGSFSVVVNR